MATTPKRASGYKSIKARVEAGRLDEKNALLVQAEKKINELQRRGVDPTIVQAEIVNTALKLKRDMLPHLYERKWYPWAWDFYSCRDRVALLTAANQVSKSSTQIRTIIEWSGNPKLWPELWPDDPSPRIYWYFYPSLEVASVEFEKKWLPEFLPRGDGKAHKTYGWYASYSKEGKISSITFNSGVTIYFQAYSKQTINLQTATVHAIFMDEECDDENLINELLSRLRGTKGYFRKVFTATIGSDFWYQAMERIGEGDEKFKTAWKRSVSLYDSMHYVDGTPSKWTAERIKEEENLCTSEAERLKRIMGRFVRDTGTLYPTFRPDVHVIDPFEIPADWQRYAAVDLGGNQSEKRSKTAIVFAAVNPKMTEVVIYDCWRGDDAQTTAGDAIDKFNELRNGTHITAKAYDYASSDFLEIATRRGEAFLPAIKERTAGIRMVNELFHSVALKIMRNGHWTKMQGELLTVSEASKVKKQTDDLTDALRYCLRLIPFDWKNISSGRVYGMATGAAAHKPDKIPTAREEAYTAMKNQVYQQDDFSAEIEAWNDAYGN